MSFTLNPDDAPPRIIRYCPASEFPSATTVAMLDPAFNVLRINHSLYEQLSNDERSKLHKTRSLSVEVTA